VLLGNSAGLLASPSRPVWESIALPEGSAAVAVSDRAFFPLPFALCRLLSLPAFFGDGDLEPLDIHGLLARPARDSMVLDLSSTFGSGPASFPFIGAPFGSLGVAGASSASNRTSGLDLELGSQRRRSSMDFFRLDFSGLAGMASCVSVVAAVLPGAALVLSFATGFESSVTALVSKLRDVLKSSLNSKSKSIEGRSNAGRLGRLFKLRVLWFCCFGDQDELMPTVDGRFDRPDNRSGVECERWKWNGTSAWTAGAIERTGPGPFISWRD
jgi:hypothetical protein